MPSTTRLLPALVDDLDVGLWVLRSGDGHIIDVNSVALRGVQRRAEDLRSTPFGELLVPALSTEAWQLLIQQVPDGGSHRVTVSLRGPDATIVPAELTLRRSDEPSSILAVTRDIGDRVDLAERLRTQRALLDGTIETLDEGVAVIDRQGRIERTNATFAALVDLPVEQLVDRSVFDPPWSLLDADAAVVAVEQTPPVQALRSGRPAGAGLHRLRGNGRARSNQDEVWVRVRSAPVTDPTGVTVGAVLTLSDVTELQLAQAERDALARTDQLTGLGSRTHIVEQLHERLDEAATLDGGRVGVLHVDLDAFRSINDTFGTVVGDQVLATIGDRLGDLGDRHVAIGRIGVDEFLVVVGGDGPATTFDARLGRLAEEIQRRTEQLLEIEGLDLRTTASIGVARWPGDAEHAAGLQRAADRALTMGRRDGRHQLRFYEQSMDEQTRTGLALDRDLRHAAARRGLEVHFQPIIDLRTGDVAAAEALVRWNHPQHGPIPPSVFIPTAEATGAISAISDLVMTTVAENLAEWNAEGLLPPGARIAVNISAAEFARRGFVERIAATLDRAGVSPAQIELEITETLLMSDLETTAARLSALDELGFLVALDDFGTGYSSLSYLHSLPLHTLKVDRCFVGDLSDGRSETITRAILSLAHGLGIIAVGEGVETDEQRSFLLDAGCDLVQGFFYAPPLPRPAFEQFLRDHDTTSTLPVG